MALTASAGQIADLTWPHVAKAAGAKISNQKLQPDGKEQLAPAEVVVLVQVNSDRVRHQMSILVREQLRRQLVRWATEPAQRGVRVSLQWADSLGPAGLAELR